jgi:hypothetical protein
MRASAATAAMHARRAQQFLTTALPLGRCSVLNANFDAD